MKKIIIAGILIVVGIVVGFPLFSIGYYTMVRTSTPEFCASCHEIQYAYNTWKTSTHVNNAHGFLIKHNQKTYIAEDFPNTTGNTTKPKEVFK